MVEVYLSPCLAPFLFFLFPRPGIFLFLSGCTLFECRWRLINFIFGDILFLTRRQNVVVEKDCSHPLLEVHICKYIFLSMTFVFFLLSFLLASCFI